MQNELVVLPGIVLRQDRDVRLQCGNGPDSVMSKPCLANPVVQVPRCDQHVARARRHRSPMCRGDGTAVVVFQMKLLVEIAPVTPVMSIGVMVPNMPPPNPIVR